MDFKVFTQLVSIGLQARVPMHFIGYPGIGKTEFVKSLALGFSNLGLKCKVFVLIGSIREPQDFGGFPIQTPEGVRLSPMAWAREAAALAAQGYMVIVFLDELTTVPPTTQAAMLRLLAENVCGELELPDYVPGKGGVVYLSASNSVDWAAGGQELQPPMANRMWHGEFPLDHEAWCDAMVSDFPAPTELPILDENWEKKHHAHQRLLVAAYVKSKGRDSLIAPPEDVDKRSGAWPSGRTWYMASRFLAAINDVAPGNRMLKGAALIGLLGHGEAISFLEYEEKLNLPDPEDILREPRKFVLPDRMDRAFAVCHSIVGAVTNNNTPKRWEAAMIALGTACKKNADIPAAAGRTLCEKAHRPAKMPKLPEDCRPFYELMQAAGLIPKD